jgi:hypothetical protein
MRMLRCDAWRYQRQVWIERNELRLCRTMAGHADIGVVSLAGFM